MLNIQIVNDCLVIRNLNSKNKLKTRHSYPQQFYTNVNNAHHLKLVAVIFGYTRDRLKLCGNCECVTEAAVLRNDAFCHTEGLGFTGRLICRTRVQEIVFSNTSKSVLIM
jgi:hypothetical protein